MVGDIINLTLNALLALGIYGGLVVAYTILSAWANINVFKINESFDRQKWINGLAKYGLLGVATILTMIGSYTAITLAPQWGVEIANVQQISAPVIYSVMLAGIAAMVVKNIGKLAQIFGLSEDLLKKIKETALKTPADKPLILDVPDLPESTHSGDTFVEGELLSKTVAEVLEQIGGRGAVASVPTGNWQEFRNAVIGRAYDIDGAYGAQCWDGMALLWLNAVGRNLITGNGAARGCWELKRDVNAGGDFELITDRNAIKAGDVLVFGGTQWGHIGMAVSGNLGNYVRLLGQNQGGDGNGSPFNEINMSLNSFLGAFRLKRWNTAPAPTPAPQPTPQPAPNADVKVGSTVRPKTAVDYKGGSLAAFVTQRDYPVIELNGDRAVLGNGLNTAFRTGNLTVVAQPTPAPAPAPQPEQSQARANMGDKVRTSATNDAQNGAFLNLRIINDGESVWTENNSNGFAVLRKGNSVRAAVPIDTLERA